jgi:hypothetical protein
LFGLCGQSTGGDPDCIGSVHRDSIDRVVDGIIHYRGCTLVSPEPPLREMIMRAMCDPPSTGNFGYSYEYEAPQVTGILSREVFRLHILLRYIDDDRDRYFLVQFGRSRTDQQAHS